MVSADMGNKRSVGRGTNSLGPLNSSGTYFFVPA